jgi:Polysaccharide lyase
LKSKHLLFLLIICSCSKNKLEEKDIKIAQQPAGIVFFDDFESKTLKKWNFKWLKLKSSAKIVNSPVRFGKFALEVSLRRDDPMFSKGKRSELAIPGYFHMGKEYWYGLSVYIPVAWKEDFKSEVLTQWFATRDKHLGEKPRSPSLALRIKKDYWIITNRYDPKPLSIKNSAPKRKLWKGKFKRGIYTDWVFHVKWSFKDDGFINIYKNRVLIRSFKGPNTYNDIVGPIMKIGIYKAPWNNPEAPSNVSKRLIYFDEIKIADKNGNLNLVSPSN